MALSPQSIARLQSGRAIAAEIAASSVEMRTYVVVIPQTPSRRDYPDRWQHSGAGEDWLRTATDITGYEIRVLQHHARYTDVDWGSDYDQVLADVTTRVTRVVVQSLDAIEPTLATWTTTAPVFQHPAAFDSSLVSSPIDGYLEQRTRYPHLWQTESFTAGEPRAGTV